MTLPEFIPFQSIPRLKRGCVITEKIDGTNAQVFIPDDLSFVLAGSCSRWITPEADNYGFARWVKGNEAELLKLGPGQHFGEWWGSGIQRRYGLAEKRFSLFNTGRWTDDNRPACCHLVPVLYMGPFESSAVDTALAKLATEGSVAAPGFMEPEGVIVYMMASRHLYKVTAKGDAHKGAEDRSAP